MKWISLRSTTRSERFQLIFYTLCLLITLAIRVSPHHRGDGWSFLVTPILFFVLVLWRIQQRQLGPFEWPTRLHLADKLSDSATASAQPPATPRS